MSDYGYVDSSQVRSADFTQDSNEVLDYPFQWAGRLDGDTIESSSFLLPDGGTSNSTSMSTVAATIFFSSSSPGLYRITNRVVTAGGRTMEWTIRVQVTE
jgi:hypothetical protein